MKIRAGGLQPRHIPPVAPPADTGLRFSFKHVDFSKVGKFCVTQCEDGYIAKFLERLRDVSQLTVLEFRTNRSSSIRSHPIEFAQTSEKEGFSSLNQQLRGSEAYQFELTANKHGRVHGFLVNDTFYVVWIDPKHLLFPRR